MNLLQKSGLTALLFACGAIVSSAQADSSFVTGAGAITATTNLDFRIIIPKFIRFQVGSAGATIDLVEFSVPAANVGNATPVARTNGGVVPVLLQGNGGNISLVGTTTGAGGLTNGSEFISYAEITSSSSNAQLNAPTLVDNAASATVTVTPNVGASVVNRTADWTFVYDNSNIVAAGTYGGVNVNNGRVVYTASLP
jgi:hypothetical protein